MRPAPDTTDLDATGIRAAILDPARDTPATVAGPQGKKAVKRFNVYRNNVTVSLINALADIFPAVQRIAGETLFREMARAFLRAHPPASPLLFQYGHDFAAFIETLEHARRMPYLADLARLERAWLTAYHAADLAPLQPQALAAVAPDRLADAVFMPHPAAGLVFSSFAVFDIFDANRSQDPVGRVDAGRSQAALVTRPGFDVSVTCLPDGDGPFFDALLSGETLGHAAAAGAEAAATFDINTAIGGLLATGAFISVRTD